MGNPGVFELSLSDGKAAYYMHHAGPQWNIAAMGMWVEQTLTAGGELTLASWDQWIKDYYVEDSGRLRMEPTTLYPRRSIADSHGADHHYVLSATRGSFKFSCRSRNRSAYGTESEFESVEECSSVGELLEAGVKQVREHRRWIRYLRRRDGFRSDQWHYLYPSISAMTDWMRDCEERAERYAAWVAATATTEIVLEYSGMQFTRSASSVADLVDQAHEHGISLTTHGTDSRGRYFRRGVVTATNARAKFFVERTESGVLVPGYQLPEAGQA